MALRRRRFLCALGTTALTAATSLVSTARKKADENDPTWTVTLGDGDYQVQTVVGAPNGDAVLVGRTGSSNDDEVWVAAVAPDGELRWKRTLDADGFPRIEGADAADGGFALAGTMGDAGRRPWLVRTDGTGEERWRREYEFEATPFGVESLPDGGYLVYGFGGDPRRVDGRATAWAMRTDDAGEPLWRREYEGSVAVDALVREDGYAIAGRYSASEDDSDAWLAVLEADGELRRSHAFGGVGDDGVAALLPAEPGHVLVGGTGSPTDADAGLLVRTDGDGRAVWRRTHNLSGYVDGLAASDGYALAGVPTDTGGGREPEKPLTFADEWGRERERRTVAVDAGEAVGLARFGDGGYAVGGWSGSGPWMAKFGRDA